MELTTKGKLRFNLYIKIYDLMILSKTYKWIRISLKKYFTKKNNNNFKMLLY
jgi:hypothetical protein